MVCGKSNRNISFNQFCILGYFQLFTIMFKILVILLSLSCLLVLLEVFKNHYRKEKISVEGIKQLRDPLFKIHLRETWLTYLVCFTCL